MRFSDHVFDLRRRSRTFFGECPYCHGHRLKKYGKEHGHQRWACRDCGKTFSGRTRTILCSSKLKPSQMRKLVSMLSDGTTLRQAANQAHVSLQTALLWKRKTQKMSENAGNTVLSGMVWVDHAYINAPMSVRKGKKRRGLSRHLLQVAAGIDSRGHVLLRLGSWGLAGTGDSRDAFLGHIAPGSVVYHDMGHFGGCFPGCKEMAVNSKDRAACGLLNPVNRLCAQVKRRFAVHLRIHRKNVPLWLDEKAFQRERMGSMGFEKYLSFFYKTIFLSGKTLRRREVFAL